MYVYEIFEIVIYVSFQKIFVHARKWNKFHNVEYIFLKMEIHNHMDGAQTQGKQKISLK